MKEKFKEVGVLKKRIQSGRSVLEILLVITVICLLTIIVIAAYKKVLLTVKVHNVEQQILALIKERKTQVSFSDGNQANSLDIKGVSGLSFHIENGTSENQKKLFWISTYVQNSALCEAISQSTQLQADLVTLNGDISGKCPAEITFYFRKNDSTSDLTYKDSDGKVQLCPENAICSGGVFSCPRGYEKTSTSCEPSGIICDEPTNIICSGTPATDENNCPIQKLERCSFGVCKDGIECVECLSNNDCSSENPICMPNNTCDCPSTANVCTSTITTEVANCKTQSTCTSPTGTYYTCTECEDGFDLSSNGEECVAQSTCGSNQCCQALLNAGFIYSPTNENDTFSVGSDTITYNGNMELSSPLNIQNCNLTVHGTLTVDSGSVLTVKNVSAGGDNLSDGIVCEGTINASQEVRAVVSSAETCYGINSWNGQITANTIYGECEVTSNNLVSVYGVFSRCMNAQTVEGKALRGNAGSRMGVSLFGDICTTRVGSVLGYAEGGSSTVGISISRGTYITNVTGEAKNGSDNMGVTVSDNASVSGTIKGTATSNIIFEDSNSSTIRSYGVTISKADVTANKIEGYANGVKTVAGVAVYGTVTTNMITGTGEHVDGILGSTGGISTVSGVYGPYNAIIKAKTITGIAKNGTTNQGVYLNYNKNINTKGKIEVDNIYYSPSINIGGDQTIGNQAQIYP